MRVGIDMIGRAYALPKGDSRVGAQRYVEVIERARLTAPNWALWKPVDRNNSWEGAFQDQ